MAGRLEIVIHLLWIQAISFICCTTSVSDVTTSSSLSLSTASSSLSLSTADSTDTRPLPPGPLYVFVEPALPLMLKVSWIMPEGHNSTSYKVFLNEADLLETNETAYNISSHLLVHGEFYVVGVTACEYDRCSNKTTNTSATYPAMPVGLQIIDRGVNDLHLQWQQQGGFSSVTVVVDYHNYSNVTDSISVSPESASGNLSHTINCNITDLPTAGGQYAVNVTVVFMELSNNSLYIFDTLPAKPESIMLVNQTTSEICVNWTQSGNAFSFSVSVNDTISSDVTIIPPSNSESSSECYGCSWPVDMCVSGLDTSGELYEISVSAEVGNLSSAWQSSFQATAPSVPSSVWCSKQENSSFTINFEPPAEGRSDSFLITYSSLVSNISVNGSQRDVVKYEVFIDNLTAGVMYLVEVRAQSYSVVGDSNSTNCTTIPNAPKEFSSSTLSNSSIRLNWKSPDGYSEGYKIIYTNSLKESVNSSVLSYDLIGLSSDYQHEMTISTTSFGVFSTNQTTSSYTFPDMVRDIAVRDVKEKEMLVLWKPPENHDNIVLYELKLMNKAGSCLKRVNLTCFNKSSSLIFTDNCPTVNDSTECNASEIRYSFKELEHSTNYSISIAASNPGGKGLAGSISFITTTPTTPANYDWIIGVVLGCFFGVLLVVLAIVLIHRWRHNKAPFASNKSVSSGSFRHGHENLTYEDEPDPVLIQDFAAHVDKMHQDSSYLFACEYLLLGKISAKNPTTVAELPENRTKNRYTDVLPFDDSRVKLIPKEDIGEGDSTDYINASYLPGFISKREYIAAQGPMRSTIDDFWLMIWQQRITSVVMVTNLCERGREKCEQYWPSNNEPICYGDVCVELMSESMLDFYIVRALEISVNSEKRQLRQYHFLTWPDFGVPEEIEHILSFVTEVRENFQGSAPMLVHCSAGVGRTGTFIVVDHLLQSIKKEPYIDVFHLVLNLRQHRPKMIQAESQYIFVHECIKTAISKGFHLRKSMYVAENDPENGNCLYVNKSELVESDPPLYVNSSELQEQTV